MNRMLLDWVIHLKQTPGERLSLGYIGRVPLHLGDVCDASILEASLDWSGQFYGSAKTVDYIIETQQYDLKPEDVLPINGGTSLGNFLACMALLKPGDEVICETPGWPQVGFIGEKMGAKLRWWHLRQEAGWKPDLDELREMITPKTKLIYINHPNNPTGSVLSEEEMTELCNIAARTGIYILSDEIYRGIEWQTTTLSPSVVNHYEHGITTSSLTKAIGVNGLRFGWFATRDKRLFQDCFLGFSDTILNHNALAEKIGEQLLLPQTYHRLREEGKQLGLENLETLTQLVERNDRFSLVPPGGSYSCLLRYHTEEPSWEFCERMLRRKPIGLNLIPGKCFHDNCEHHLRVGFGGKPELFKAGLQLVEQGVGEYGTKG